MKFTAHVIMLIIAEMTATQFGMFIGRGLQTDCNKVGNSAVELVNPLFLIHLLRLSVSMGNHLKIGGVRASLRNAIADDCLGLDRNVLGIMACSVTVSNWRHRFRTRCMIS